jgi:DNA-binding NarL/FixJ family response regulator
MPKEAALSCVVCPYGQDITSELKRLRTLVPDVPIVVFGLRPDRDLARIAVQENAQGFVHAEMSPESIVHALSLTLQGAYVLPRGISENVVSDESFSSELAIFDPSQRDRLKLKLEQIS